MHRIGRYTIDRTLGTGGMGTVYLATDDRTGRPAAVKVLPASLARETGFVDRFEREIDALQRLDNPHIVRIYDSGTVSETEPARAAPSRTAADAPSRSAANSPTDAPSDADAEETAWYYAMEYVPGETLLATLRRERRLPWRMVIDYGVQVCSALKAAHDAGIVHRDLKPSNLLITEQGTVKLVDFGVAQIFASSRLTKTGGVIGTAEFMSPEQAQGMRANPKSDLYSLGAVLYCMLTGRPPFSGQTMLDVLHKHRFGQFDKPRHFAPDCPQWLEDVVCHLLEKDPDKRPADAYVTSRRLAEIPKKVELSQSEPLPGARAQPPEIGPEDESDAAVDPLDSPTRTAPGILVAAGAPPRGPGEATIMHALMREELARQAEAGPVGKLLENVWVLLTLLTLVLLSGWWFLNRGLTPQQHLSAATALLAQPPGDAWTTARVEHLEPLIEQGGDWRTRAEPLLDQVVAYEDNARTVRRATARLGATGDPPANEAARLLRLAQAQRQLGDTRAAARLLEALLAVTAGQPQYAAEREAAAALRKDLRAATATDRQSLIQSARDRAQTLRAQGQTTQAEEIQQALQILYGDDLSDAP